MEFALVLLGMASQRIEYLVIELFGNAWMHEILAGWKRRERGCIPGFVESGVIIYVISKQTLMNACLKQEKDNQYFLPYVILFYSKNCLCAVWFIVAYFRVINELDN